MSFFSVRGRGGGGGLQVAGLQVGPTFLICSYFSLRMPYYPSFFTLKYHLLVENPECFPRSLGFNTITNFFFREHAAKHHFFSFDPSLFSLYYFHSYYPAYLVLNLFLTTHCDQFRTWKSPAIPTFLHQ